jgi:hypothetical protein
LEKEIRETKEMLKEIRKRKIKKRFEISKYKKIRVWTLPLAIYFT